MITPAAVVALVASLGLVLLNWRAYQSDAHAAGWTSKRQVVMAAIWIAVISALTLIMRMFAA